MDQIIFKRKASVNGGSMVVVIPPELIDFLELKEGNEIAMTAGSKSGKYITLWNNEIPRTISKKGKKKTEA